MTEHTMVRGYTNQIPVFEPLVETLRRHTATWEHPLPCGVELGTLLFDLEPAFARIGVRPRHLPYGRYLLHHEEKFNVQLDVFSRDYTGSVHAHLTWGLLWVIRGGLRVWDHDYRDGKNILQRTAWLPAGGGQCFGPPASDWHRVASPDVDEQTISIHIYGADFDLETGVALDEDDKPRRYTRGPLGDLSHVAPAFFDKAHA